MHDVATVSGKSATNVPTGTVQFYTCALGNTDCTPAIGQALGPAEPLINGVATSPNYTSTVLGVHAFAAVYIPSGTVYAGSSETGTVADHETFAVTAVPTTTAPSGGSKHPAKKAPPVGKSKPPVTRTHPTPVVVPTTHTGEPWSGWLYWVLTAMVGVMGLGGVTKGLALRRRHSGYQH